MISTWHQDFLAYHSEIFGIFFFIFLDFLNKLFGFVLDSYLTVQIGINCEFSLRNWEQSIHVEKTQPKKLQFYICALAKLPSIINFHTLNIVCT